MKLSRLVVIVMCIALISYCLIGCSIFSSVKEDKPTVVFCDSVNDRLEPIGQKTSAPPGKFTALLTSPKEFGVSKLRVSLVQNGDKGEKEAFKTELDVNSKWNRVSTIITIPVPGTWTIIFSNTNGEEIARGTVDVIPAK